MTQEGDGGAPLQTGGMPTLRGVAGHGSGDPSLLELLHPGGRCLRRLLLGSGCPLTLRPTDSFQGSKADLVVIAPDAHEAEAAGWLDGAVAKGAAMLSEDGLICALVPPLKRGRLVRLLVASGLEIGGAFLYRGSATGEDSLLPLRAKVTKRIAATMPASYDAVGRLKVQLVGWPGAIAILRRCHPGALLVGRHPGAPPLFEWVLQSSLRHGLESAVAVQAKWRRNRGSVVLRTTDDNGQLTGIAKLTLNELNAGSRISREAEFLQQIGKDLQQVGISTPEVRIDLSDAGVPVLLESVVPGDIAATLLMTRRISSSGLLATLGEGLLAWSRQTHVTRTLDGDWMEREVLRPATTVVPLLPEGGKYLDWLRARCHELSGRNMPLVATHGDLTMWNVLVGRQGFLGIVDWEDGTPAGLPLSDLCYSAVDLLAAVGRYRDRVGAFSSCFEAGRENRQVAGLRTKLGQALALSQGAALLYFHACWLQHAAREMGKRAAVEAHPFREILGRLASQPESFVTPGLAP